MKMSTFQLAVLGISILLLLFGVGLFAVFGGLGSGASVGTVTVWGTLDQNAIDQGLAALRQNDKSFQGVTYVQKKSTTYDADLVSAMASGRAPDLFLISQDEVLSFADKIATIPYGTISQGSFTSAYVDEAGLLLNSQGELGLPFALDPLVMYWNRDLFAAAGVSQPPAFWNDFLTLAPKLTALDTSGAVKRAGIALGASSNVAHAKEILSALMMQAGDPIVARGQNGVQAVLGNTPQTASEGPAASALRFYTEFGNPSKTTYSWNRSLPLSTDAFAGGIAAVYIGFASEYAALAARNPNLHFSVALLPQVQGSATALTFGRLYALAMPLGSRNAAGALAIAQKMTAQGAAAAFTGLGLPPVRRDVQLDTSNNAAAGVFVQSALISRAWLDPNPAKTDGLFAGMIESVTSGKSDASQAVFDAAQSLAALMPRQ